MARDFSGHGTGSYLPKAAQDHAEHTGCYCQTWHGIVIVAKCGPRSFAKHTGSYCQTRYGIVIIAKCGPRSCRTHRILLPNMARDLAKHTRSLTPNIAWDILLGKCGTTSSFFFLDPRDLAEHGEHHILPSTWHGILPREASERTRSFPSACANQLLIVASSSLSPFLPPSKPGNPYS